MREATASNIHPKRAHFTRSASKFLRANRQPVGQRCATICLYERPSPCQHPSAKQTPWRRPANELINQLESVVKINDCHARWRIFTYLLTRLWWSSSRRLILMMRHASTRQQHHCTIMRCVSDNLYPALGSCVLGEGVAPSVRPHDGVRRSLTRRLAFQKLDYNESRPDETQFRLPTILRGTLVHSVRFGVQTGRIHLL